jgi:hypothetical protein
MAVAIAILNASLSHDCCSLIKFPVGDAGVEIAAKATYAVTVQAETGEETSGVSVSTKWLSVTLIA